MQGLQREGGVAHPGVAVVPVALAAGGLGQRGGQRGDGRAGRHVGQALDREGRALDRLAPAVVEQRGPGRARRARSARSRRAAPRRRRRRRGAPSPRPTRARSRRARRRASTCRARTRLPSMPSARSVCEPDRRAGAGRVGRVPARRRRASTPPASARSRTPARRPARPRRCPRGTSTVRTSMWSASSSAGGRVCGVTVVLAVRRAHRQRVADDDPAGRRLPRRDEDVRARLVGPRGRNVDSERAEPEGAGLRGRAGCRTRSARRSAGRRASRRSRPGRRARRCGSRRGTRSRRSAGTATARPRFALRGS